MAITILSSRELTPGRREGVFWVCLCKIAVVSWTADGILRNKANSGSGLTPRPECRFAFCETEPMLAWNGFVRAKTLACIQLSEILGAEPLARMPPPCAALWIFAKQSQSSRAGRFTQPLLLGLV